MPTDGHLGTDSMPGMFAMIGMEYLTRHADPVKDVEVFARISEKNHAHSTVNPLATHQKRFTLDEIIGAPMVAWPNTLLMCSANCDGAAAAVVVSDDRLRRMDPDQRRRAVRIRASVLTTDPWQPTGDALPDFNTLTRDAARQAYDRAGVDPGDLDLVELHDCFATAELVHYDNLMLCPPGDAVEYFGSGATWRDGRTPVNVSGGLQSKGHPIAATGIAGVYEVATHLRGEAGDRQVDGARIGLAHVAGLGQSCGVHILERA
jgi:acetyl-CoA acetyltransferase